MRPTGSAPIGSALLLALGLLPTAASARGPAQTVQERLGHPPTARLLVIHADDLGMSHSVNRATFEALEKGWITSASILVPCPWFPEVAAFARAHPDADLGIHLALNSEWKTYRWGPVSPADSVPSLLDEEGYLPLLQPPVVEGAKIPEVERELRAQIQRARGAGIKITHLDTHMGTLGQSAGLLGAYRKMGAEFGVPVLLPRDAPVPPGASIPEQEILIDQLLQVVPGVPLTGWREAYEKALAPLPPGVYEVIVHLAYDDEEMRGATVDHPDWGAAWRQFDFDVVRSEAFRSFLRTQGFVLVSWRDLARAAGSPSVAAAARR
jgi:predicted glycoside hydrolase/deacetylase ChbG (UPF0249 family)